MVREQQGSGPPERSLCVFCWYQGWLRAAASFWVADACRGLSWPSWLCMTGWTGQVCSFLSPYRLMWGVHAHGRV